MDNRESKIDMVKKLLCLAEDGSNENESKLALKKASELMEKYEISLSEVKASNQPTIQPQQRRTPVHPNMWVVIQVVTRNYSNTDATSTSTSSAYWPTW